MIIECICGKKKFEVNSDLIPSTGRTIQCGSCEKIWFFDPNKENLKINEELEQNISEPAVKQKTKEISASQQYSTAVNSVHHVHLCLTAKNIPGGTSSCAELLHCGTVRRVELAAAVRLYALSNCG